MRIFATGAIQFVMGKNWPEDQPIEARMVTKAIERAQNTVEQRNAEIRKNVLQYDEVMNEQRKVIYKRRDQVLDGSDLSEDVSEFLAQAVDGRSRPTAPATSWRTGTSRACTPRSTPSGRPSLTADQIRGAATTDELYDLLMAEAVAPLPPA